MSRCKVVVNWAFLGDWGVLGGAVYMRETSHLGGTSFLSVIVFISSFREKNVPPDTFHHIS